MKAIIPLVEGQGDEAAVPTLIQKVLGDLNVWQWYVGDSVRVSSLGKLRKELAYYLSIAVNKRNCAALLILLDSDDSCPFEEAVSQRRFARLTYQCLSPSFLLIANTKLGF